MKKKVAWLVNLATICLCVCAIAIGVYSLKTATLNVSGTVGFTANNCNVKITSTVECAADTNNASAKWGQISKKSIELGAKSTSGSTTNNQILTSNEGELNLDTMNFNDLSTDGNKIQVTFDIENKSTFEAYFRITTMPTLTTSSGTSISFYGFSITIKNVSGENITSANKIILGEDSSTNTYSIVVTLTVEDLSSDDAEALKDAKLEMGFKFERYKKPEMPTKGDLITMDLGGEYDSTVGGLKNTYKVLKTDGNTAFVFAMFEAKTSQYWTKNVTTTDGNNNTVTKYDGSDLDTYLNSTWYNSLNPTTQSAIVPSTITQYSYEYNGVWGNRDNNTHASYADYSSKSAVETLENKKVYALDIEDIEEYFGGNAGSESANSRGKFSTSDIWILFWNTASMPSPVTNPWLRSARSNNFSDYAWFIRCVMQSPYVYPVTSDNETARPAFKIDLSKVSWSEC